MQAGRYQQEAMSDFTLSLPPRLAHVVRGVSGFVLLSSILGLILHLQSYQHNPWLIHLVIKLLENDREVSSLLAHDPFLDGEPPRYDDFFLKKIETKFSFSFIRLDHYSYRYTSRTSNTSAWWKRRKIGEYMPTVDLRSLEGIRARFGW